MGRRNQLTRKERERIRHKNEILDAALRLFSAKGFHNVSMHEIAKEAEFAIGTLYKFFDTKEDLYKSLVLRLAETFHSTLSSALETNDSEMDKLRAFVELKGQLFSENLTMIRLYLAETRGAVSNSKGDLDSILWKSRSEILHKLAKVFKSGIRKGVFNSVADPYSLAVGFDALTNGFLFLWLKDPERHPYPHKHDIIMDIFFHNLLAIQDTKSSTAKPRNSAKRKSYRRTNDE